ncbi:hypothetical protein HDU84_006624 [Entophlyctis sp. JEL0112]|nr:hypothetical protein HDU84_006624 [Entophlyctis sp. JEL0112]
MDVTAVPVPVPLTLRVDSAWAATGLADVFAGLKKRRPARAAASSKKESKRDKDGSSGVPPKKVEASLPPAPAEQPPPPPPPQLPEDNDADPFASLKKKKKKKGISFDVPATEDAVESSQIPPSTANTNTDADADADADATVPASAPSAGTGDLDFLDSKKKKKKKRAADLAEFEELMRNDSPAADPNEGSALAPDHEIGDDDDDGALGEPLLEKDFDDLDDDEDGAAESSALAVEYEESWLGTDREYSYPELIARIFKIIRQNNPDLAGGEKKKYTLVPPQVVREGTKKSAFVNVVDIARRMRREPDHLIQFLFAELGTSGSIDGAQRLVIKGRFQQKHIEVVLKRYIGEYVTCKTCRSGDTLLKKENRLFFLECQSCGSTKSVSAIKTGFMAQATKRSAMRNAAA